VLLRTLDPGCENIFESRMGKKFPILDGKKKIIDPGWGKNPD
jgi:hypothetical protein